MVAYEFAITADPGKICPEVGRLIESVNSALSTFGVADRLSVVSRVGTMTLTSDRELSESQENDMRAWLQERLEKALPECSVQVGAPRRQTGKSSDQSNASN